MRKLTVLIAIAAGIFWTNTAFAQYSALEDFYGAGPSIGLGGIVISGNNAAGDSDSEFMPTVNLTGLTESVAWQAFYGFGDASLFGGSVDWILADNFDECAMCPEDGLWWIGIGPTVVSYSDLFADVQTNALSETEFGVNVGGGLRWDRWGVDLYLHYFPTNELFAVQGAVVYDVTN